MKKILITESQFGKLRKQLKEQTEDNRYSKRVRVSIWTHTSEVKYHGMEINDITAYDMTLSFLIYDERREWGIKSLGIYDIQGPKEIEAEVDYYIDDDTQEQATIRIPLDWENNLEEEKVEGRGAFTIGDELDIELVQGEGGKLVAKMRIDIETF